MRIVVLLFLCLSSVFVFAQNRVPIIGKLYLDTQTSQGVVVTNTSTRQTKLVNSNGIFNLLGKVGDTLHIKNMYKEEQKYVLTANDLDSEIVYLPFKSKIQDQSKGQLLDEIYIDKFDLKSIGLDFSGMKKYTPMEKRVHTATTSPGGIMIAIPVDAIINSISGKTAMLKKAVAYESIETLSDKLLGVFSEEELSRLATVDIKQIKGFVYYLVGDNEMKKLLKEKHINQRRVEFRISELIADFKNRVKE